MNLTSNGIFQKISSILNDIKLSPPGISIDLENIKIPNYNFPKINDTLSLIEDVSINYEKLQSWENFELTKQKIIDKTSQAFIHAKKIAPMTFKQIRNIFCVHLKDLGYTLVINFRKPKLVVEIFKGNYFEEFKNQHNYQLNLDSKLWIGFLLNEIQFDEINFSRLFKVNQTDKSFNIHLIRILKSIPEESLLHETEKNLKNISNSKILIKKFKGKNYQIKQKCPHLGVSLNSCEPDDKGHIVIAWLIYSSSDIITGIIF